MNPQEEWSVTRLMQPLEGVRDRFGDVGIIPGVAGQVDLQFVGHGRDSVDAFGGADRIQLLCIAGGMARECHGARYCRNADRRSVDSGFPAQLVDYGVLQFPVGFHRISILLKMSCTTSS